MSDARTGKLVVLEAARTDSNKENSDSKLLIATDGSQRAVYSLISHNSVAAPSVIFGIFSVNSVVQFF